VNTLRYKEWEDLVETTGTAATDQILGAWDILRGQGHYYELEQWPLSRRLCLLVSMIEHDLVEPETVSNYSEKLRGDEAPAALRRLRWMVENVGMDRWNGLGHQALRSAFSRQNAAFRRGTPRGLHNAIDGRGMFADGMQYDRLMDIDITCRILGIPRPKELTPFYELLRTCHGAWLFVDLAVVCAHPTYVHAPTRTTSARNDDGYMLSNDKGPVVGYSDGWGTYAIRNIEIPPHVITDPSSITVEEIDGEENMERRQIMMARYGFDKYVKASGATEVHQDKFGVLFTHDIKLANRWNRNDVETVRIVKVINSTPEPDGKQREYFLRVPSTITTAKAAVAWTFGKGVDQYAPLVET
jgi:hypothetical protein